MGKNGETDRGCAFCGKAETDVFMLVPGRNAAICEECTLRGLTIVEENERIRHEAELRNLGRSFAELMQPARHEAPEPLHPTLEPPANTAGTDACAFCGEPRDHIAWPISGPDVVICDICVMKAACVVALPDRPQAFDRRYEEIIGEFRPRALGLIRKIVAEPTQADAIRVPVPNTCIFCGENGETLVSLREAAEGPICEACIFRCSHTIRGAAQERGIHQAVEFWDRLLGKAALANADRAGEIVGIFQAEIGKLPAPSAADQQPPQCAFCGKKSGEASRLVGEPAACICDNCIWTSLCILAGPNLPEVSRDQFDPIRDRVETEVGGLIRILFAGGDPAT